MTTKQVAEEIGVVPATLYNWLRKPSPTDLGPVTLTKIASLFGLSLEQMQRPTAEVIAASESRTPGFARVRVLRQIDGLLAEIADPNRQAHAAQVVVETLRNLNEEAGVARPGARKPGSGPTLAVLALLRAHRAGWSEASLADRSSPRGSSNVNLSQCAREWC
jgi:transposase-like protein